MNVLLAVNKMEEHLASATMNKTTLQSGNDDKTLPALTSMSHEINPGVVSCSEVDTYTSILMLTKKASFRIFSLRVFSKWNQMKTNGMKTK